MNEIVDEEERVSGMGMVFQGREEGEGWDENDDVQCQPNDENDMNNAFRLNVAR